MIFWKIVATDVEEQAGVPPLEEQQKYFRHHWERFVEYRWAAKWPWFHKSAVGQYSLCTLTNFIISRSGSSQQCNIKSTSHLCAIATEQIETNTSAPPQASASMHVDSTTIHIIAQILICCRFMSAIAAIPLLFCCLYLVWFWFYSLR